MFTQRLAPLAEVLLVLALGNLVGETLFSYLAPSSVIDGTASERAQAFMSGLLIFMRLGLAGLFGFLLLYYRRGLTPRQAGLSRNNQSLKTLAGTGILLGLVSSFLVSLLFAIHAIIPLGAGLPAWWTYSDTPINLAFWISVLGTSVIIPPLTEEIMARGYFRVRLVESYGTMAGVVMTSLVFGLSHTRYLANDGMLLLFMLIILINSVSWTYLAQKTGSIIPSLFAHGVSNGIGTAVLFNTWIPFFLVTAAVLIFYKPIIATLKEFLQDWRADQQKNSLWQGLLVILVILVATLSMLNLAGRTVTIISLGVFCLFVTAINLVMERMSK